MAARASAAMRMCWLALLLLLSGPLASALEITSVTANSAMLDRSASDALVVRYRIDQAAELTLRIYDPRELLVRRVVAAAQPAGEHTLRWDLLDEAGRPVPPEAYHYTLTAVDAAGQVVEHDLSEITGAERLKIRDLHWDAATGRISYGLPRHGRVNLRVGLANDGPLLRTVASWVPRSAGAREEHWDGMDASGVLNLARHPQLDLWAEAFAFSDNTVIVRADGEPAAVIEELPWGRVVREPKQTSRKRMYDHAQQPHESRGDFTISLSLPPDLPLNAQGIAVVKGIVPVRLDIADHDRARALSRRFEPVFFVDGTFTFENETGFLPMTWLWDTRGTNPGTHFLTANLRGYEGNFGMATVRVAVPANRAPEN